MKRRRYLTVVGALMVGLTGCNDAENSGDRTTTPTTTTEATTTSTTSMTVETTSTTEDTTTAETIETTTEEPTTETTTQQSGKANIILSNSELAEAKNVHGEEFGTKATIKNTGSGWAEKVELTTEFYDSAGNVLGTNTGYLSWFPPGKTWEPYIKYLGSKEPASQKSSLEVRESTSRRNPEGINLMRSDLEKNEDSAIVTGQIKNTRDESMSLLSVYAHYLTKDESIMASNNGTIRELGGGKARKFEVKTWISGDRLDQITDHQVVLVT